MYEQKCNSNMFLDNLRKLLLFKLRNDLYKIITALDAKKILDIGCGNGNLLSGLRGGAIRISGIDISQSSLHIAKKRNLYTDLAVANATLMPYPSECFNVIIAGFILHELNEWERSEVLRELFRLLNKKGVLVIIDFSRCNDNSFLNRIMHFLFKKEEELIGKIDPVHFINYSDFIERGGVCRYFKKYKISQKFVYFGGNVATLVLKRKNLISETIGQRR